ncbi:MAG: Bax inhibitor-1/YccA family protein [Burkholderiales bacterium]|nr:Bax inhibitor-1/YccA family protein [Burkholderiales bacterium]
MRSGNPALSDKTFTGLTVIGADSRMTVAGTVNRTAILLALLLVAAAYTWSRVGVTPPNNVEMAPAPDLAAVMPLLWVGLIGGFIVSLVTIFAKKWSPWTAPLYAVLEGLALGGLSAIFELRFPGIVLPAVGLTFATLAALLLAYRSGLVRATENFKLGVVAATGGIALLYLVNLVMGFFGHSIGLIHEGGWAGIVFSLFVVTIAALNLVLDFDFIEQGAAQGAPKYMEWYGAFGLLVTLVWLYLEILRLLGKARR